MQSQYMMMMVVDKMKEEFSKGFKFLSTFQKSEAPYFCCIQLQNGDEMSLGNYELFCKLIIF